MRALLLTLALVAFMPELFLSTTQAMAKSGSTQQQAEIIYKQLRSADKYKAADLYHDLAELHAKQCVSTPVQGTYKLKHSSTCDEMVRVLLMNAYFAE